jgi:DNA-binding GntR family transcriptional regulator
MSEPIRHMQVQRNVPIREQVAAILRDAIIDMRLQPGQLLIERELCELTAASRPSIREALRQLEAEGLVESPNGRGTFVSIADPVLAGHIYQVRAELEGFAAELFALGASDELRTRLRRAFADIELAASVVDNDGAHSVLKAKNELYNVLFQGAGNPILDQMLHTLQRRVNQLRSLSLAQPGRPEQSVTEIRVMVEAVENRDGPAARAAAASHVRNAAAAVLSVLGDTNTVR